MDVPTFFWLQISNLLSVDVLTNRVHSTKVVGLETNNQRKEKVRKIKGLD